MEYVPEDQHKHFVGKVAQKAVIMRDGKVLLCMNPGGTLWDLPGGRLHKEESIEAGLVREVKEELGIDITVGEPISVGTFGRGPEREPHVLIIYEASMNDEKQEFILDPKEIGEIRWIAPTELHTTALFSEYHKLLPPYFIRKSTSYTQH